MRQGDLRHKANRAVKREKPSKEKRVQLELVRSKMEDLRFKEFSSAVREFLEDSDYSE